MLACSTRGARRYGTHLANQILARLVTRVDSSGGSGQGARRDQKSWRQSHRRCLGGQGHRSERRFRRSARLFRTGRLPRKSAKVENDALLKNSDIIKVETADHVVTLKGTVLSPEGKTRAEEIARATDGVQQVVNLLTLQKK